MSRRPRPLDIAIVGMACRFPGAEDLFAFWENQLAARDAIRDVSPDRWDPAIFFDPDSTDSGRGGGRRGGYLDTPLAFDPAAYGIMPRTVEGGEPEQFLVLDAARAALDDAGLAPGMLDGRRVEVVIGRGNSFNRGNLTRLQHGRVLEQTLAILRALHPEWSAAEVEAIRTDLRSGLPPFEAATIPGQLTNATAGRVADRFNLAGASYVVDAASASGLVAVDLGARALADGRADLAIVGSVYIEADVDFPMVFSRLGGLSRSGRARPFAEDADGMVPGEGVGLVVLKRRADAERDGDRVYAVLKGLGLASGGRGPGLAAPAARGHLRAILRAYRSTGIDPATIGLVEGHGLGVPAADRAELRALRAAFPRPAGGPARVLGAASGLIGHAMPAAGMAGLIKAALSLYHRMLPASVGADRPHPLLARPDSPFSLNPASRPWIEGGPAPRRAGVNAFGFAGIDAHAILEEHTASADGSTPGASPRWPSEAVLIAADDRDGLVHTARTLIERLKRRPDVSLKDLAYTLAREVSRGDQPTRLGVVVDSTAELIARLESIVPRLADPSCRSIRDGRGVYYWDEPLGRAGGLAFLFPGEGSQYPGMLADLCPHFPEIRARFDLADRLAREAGSAVLPSELLFGGSAGWDPGLVVNVVLSAQWGLYQILSKLGIRPSAVAGHSSGEFLALAAAGSIEVDHGLEARFGALAALFARVENPDGIASRMVGVAAGRARVEAAIADRSESEVVVAVDNCPHQVILAGPRVAVAAVEGRLREQGVMTEELAFAHPYHTPAFAPRMATVRDFFGSLEIRPPAIPLYSCCAAARFPQAIEEVRALAVAQWTRPVEFRRTVEAMHADGLRVFVDVGARGNLAGFVEDTLRGRPAFAVAANVPRRSGLTQLNHLVASLFAQGIALDAGFLFARRRPALVDLSGDAPARSTFAIPVGFPQMTLSPDLLDRLRTRTTAAERPVEPLSFPPVDDDRPHVGSDRERFALREALAESDDHAEADAMRSHFDTMDDFLQTQRAVMESYWAAGGAPEDHPGGMSVAQRFEAVGEPYRSFEATADHHDCLTSEYPTHKNGSSLAVATPRARTRLVPASGGPWAGEVARMVEGREVEAVVRLDAKDDPVAENHTFGGRRVSALDPSRKGLPVVPFTVMAEMLAQVSARLAPGMTLVGFRALRARRWIRYEDEPVALEVVARVDPERPGEVAAALYNRAATGDTPAVEGVIVFGPSRAEPPPAVLNALDDPEVSRFTARNIYDEQWLFHGPRLQAVVGIGEISDRGIDGTLRVLPRGGLYRDPAAPRPLSDPIVLDAYTHLLGAWGLDRLPEGDVIFPLRLGRLDVFGDDPPEGTDCACRVRVTNRDRHRVTVDAEILRPDGRVWMRLTDWEDWRFYWPSRYRDVFRQPDRTLIGEPLAVAPPGGEGGVVAVWLEPPGDMGRPVWRDVLEQTQLSPVERAGCLRPVGHEGRRTLRLWGRIAAKEAARRIWLDAGKPPVFPSDLSIEPDPRGRPVLRLLAEPGRDDLPSVSIAHTEGVAVALASNDPRARPGIDVERIVERAESFETIAFSTAERARLDALGAADRSEWVARFWCAKEAAAKATGLGLIAGPSSVEVVSADLADGVVVVALGPELTAACPTLAGASVFVQTHRRGEYAWAWTLLNPEGDPR